MSDLGAARARRSEVWRLGLLFGALYFLQGIGEPTEGLIAQPARCLLKRWGRSDRDITTFMALLAIPWTFKPLYGLLTDFVPIFGTRRRGYLLLASGATTISLLGLFAFPIAARVGSRAPGLADGAGQSPWRWPMSPRTPWWSNVANRWVSLGPSRQCSGDASTPPESLPARSARSSVKISVNTGPS